MDSTGQIVAKKERLLEFDRNLLCNSVGDSGLHSHLKVFLEPLYDPKHELWLGEECRFMVTHGLRHILNVFRYATRLYHDTAKNRESRSRNEDFLKEDIDKVCLIVSIWLHDWGMAGPEIPDELKPLLPKERNEKFLKMFNETLEAAGEKLGERFKKIGELRYDCPWIRSIHSLITYFNVTKASQSINLDVLGQKLENYDRDLEDIAVICLFHRFSLAKLKEFGKEHLSGLSALLAFLDGCDENWQRLSSMEHVQRIMARGIQRGDEMYQRIDSALHFENLRLMGIEEETSKNLGDAWDKGKFAELLGLLDSLLNTSKNRDKLASLREDIEDYINNFVDQFDEHIEPKLLIKDVYFKNGEVILVPRHKLVIEENPAIEKTVEKIREHLRNYREGLEKLGLRFTEESIRLWKPKDGSPEKLEIPEITSSDFECTRKILTLTGQDEGQCLEFKSTLRVDLDKPETPYREVEDRVVKEICGFLNTLKGGTLLIGVGDHREKLGLERDYKSLSCNTKRCGRDKFMQHLYQVIRSRLIPEECSHNVDICFGEAEGKDVCLVDVKPWLTRSYRNLVVMVEKKKNEEVKTIYVRQGNAAIPKGIQQAMEYLTMIREHLEVVSRREEPIHEAPEPQPISPIKESINFREISSSEELAYKITTDDRFVERPLEQGEWESKKKNVITFSEEKIGEAIKKLSFHDIVLITGQPNVGKSTFLLFFLEEYLRKAIGERHTVIFLNRFVGREELDSVLENIDSFVQSKYGLKNVLLVIDGLHRIEPDDHYVNKCIKLFELASSHRCKLIATLRDSEKDYLKNKLEPKEREPDEWRKFAPKEVPITYETKELERILVKYLNYYKEKIKLEDISFDEMNKFFFGEEIPLERKEICQKFKSCVESVIKKSEGLAGYVDLLIEEISEHERVFSEKVVEKYPIGMVNLILNTIQRDYYIENDKLIPLLMILLTKSEYPSEFSLTEHFFESFKTWGVEILDYEQLRKGEKEKVLGKINNLTTFYTIQTNKSRLLDYWTDAIDEAVHKEKYDENYVKVVNSLKKAEDTWKYRISEYISYAKSELKESRFDPDMLYLVGDLAKLGFIADLNVLDFATEFFKEKQEDYATTLSSQLSSLKLTLCFLWRRKAHDSLEKSNYDLTIDSYKKALDLASEDYTLDWEIGKCYEKMGQEWEALDWYIKSAKKRDTPLGYRFLSHAIGYQYKKARRSYATADVRLKYLELQQDALTKALENETTEPRGWGMLGEVYKDKGRVLAEMGDCNGAISQIEKALQAYENGMGLVRASDSSLMSWYYREIGYCYDDLQINYWRLGRPESELYLKKAIEFFEKATEIYPDTNNGNLNLAKVMSWGKYYKYDPNACGNALAKIRTNELTRVNLIKYHVLCGVNHENKGKFIEALSDFELAKKTTLMLFNYPNSDDMMIPEESMRSLVDDIYQHLGSCYEKAGQYEKASENYTMYVDLNAYSRLGIDGRIYFAYGKKLFRIGNYEAAHFFVSRAKKRNPSDDRVLRLMTLLDEKLGHFEQAINNLESLINLLQSKKSEGEYILAFIARDKDWLTRLRGRLETNKQTAQILEEICNIADFANVVNEEKEMRTSDLSSMFDNVKLRLDHVDVRTIGCDISDLNDLKSSALCQSYNLKRDFEHQNEYGAKHHITRAQAALRMQTPLLEAFHRIFAATINTVTVARQIKKGELKGNEKQERIIRLSEEWGKTGRRISKCLIIEPHSVAIRCFELSVKINPENLDSWHNLGWEYFYEGKYDEALKAFRKNLEIEEKTEKKYCHFSKIGLGKIEEARGKPAIAAELLKDGVSLFLDLYAQKDPQQAFTHTMKTVGSIADLGFIESDIDRKVTLLKHALEVNRKTLAMLETTESKEIASTEFVTEKTLVLKRQITQLESYLKGLEKAFQLETINVGKSFGEIILTHLTDLKKHIRSTEEEIEILASEVSQKAENYILFKQLFESHFDYKMEKLRSNKNLLLELLDNILGACMKMATRESPFEASARVFQYCQAYCKEFLGEECRVEFINVFNGHIVASFSKIVLGEEYKLGPIESESELTLLVNEFKSTLGKLGARVPSIDEINEAVRMRKRGQKI